MSDERTFDEELIILWYPQVGDRDGYHEVIAEYAGAIPTRRYVVDIPEGEVVWRADDYIMRAVRLFGAVVWSSRPARY